MYTPKKKSVVLWVVCSYLYEVADTAVTVNTTLFIRWERVPLSRRQLVELYDRTVELLELKSNQYYIPESLCVLNITEMKGQ